MFKKLVFLLSLFTLSYSTNWAQSVGDPTYDQLVWSDEFDISGVADSEKWFHQTQLPAGGNWYNGEVQHYTNRTENTVVESGILKIIAKKENFTDQGFTKAYTSARLNSKYAFKYGRVEIRAKLPSGVGTWPALWLLGKNINEDGAYWDNEGFGTTPWPQCGEIDIMEHWGDNQNYVQSATHTPSSFGGTVNHGGQVIPTASSEFHVYTLDWYEDRLVFGVDDVIHYTYNPSVKNSDTWPFTQEFYLLFNIAIQPSIEASFTESAMEIDYVRVYQEQTEDPDLDGDGFTSMNDCDDTNANVNPDQTEIVYNGLDDDCDASTLDDDLDQDGYIAAEDCDDTNPNINPGQQAEIPYNGLDDDCNSSTPDDDLDRDGFIAANDCDDLNPEINPNRDEIPYNGIDDDCNPSTLDDDLDEDGFIAEIDCNDMNASINPGQTDIPNNGIDDDCNGGDLIITSLENSGDPWSIFPIPFTDHINISANNIGDQTGIIELYHPDGRLIRSMKAQPSQNTITIDGLGQLQEGMYLLIFRNRKGVERYKLFKN